MWQLADALIGTVWWHFLLSFQRSGNKGDKKWNSEALKEPRKAASDLLHVVRNLPMQGKKSLNASLTLASRSSVAQKQKEHTESKTDSLRKMSLPQSNFFQVTRCTDFLSPTHRSLEHLEQHMWPQPSLQRLTSSKNTVILFVLPI